MRREYKIAIGASVLLAILYILIAPHIISGNVTRYQQMTSQVDIHQIATCVLVYVIDGKLPEALSDLYNDGIIDELDIFYSSVLFPDTKIENEEDARFIDLTSNYRHAKFGDDHFLVYEQPGIWKDRTVAYSLLKKVDGEWSHAESKRVTGGEFEALLLTMLEEKIDEPQ